MRKFISKEIETYLRAVDANLRAPFRLIVIGGAAAALAYRSDQGTHDIDTTHGVSSIREALEAAARATGLAIPVTPAGMWDAPYEYEQRLRPVPLEGLTNLSVFVPEVHDWILMKSMRADERDLQAIQDVAGRVPIDKEMLRDRFVQEMSHVIGSPRRVQDNFLAVIERLFGSAAADEAGRQLRKRRTRP